MNQLSFDFNTSNVISSSGDCINRHSSIENFTIVSVYDRMTSSNQAALQYNADWSDVSVNISLNIIPNSNFAAEGYLYFDTISELDYKDFVAQAKMAYADGRKIEVNCYMAFSNTFLVKDIHRNLHSILIGYYINNNILHRVPSTLKDLPEWLRFDPSLKMFFIKSDFVLEINHDYSNTATCCYRTDRFGMNASDLYKYANKASSAVCSNQFIEDLAAKQGKVAKCAFTAFGDITTCSYYKEDKFKLLTTEFYSKHEKTLVVRKLECYLMRQIQNESYSLVFEEVDMINKKNSILKKFVYGDVSFDTLDKRDQLILEAGKQNTSLISDYISDYDYNIINHIQSAVEFKQKGKTETKVSYLSKLVSQP